MTAKLYDLSKKGTIVIGQMRTGTHMLMNIISAELERKSITHTHIGEVLVNVNYLCSELFPRVDKEIYKRNDNSMEPYTVSSITNMPMVKFMTGCPKILQQFSENFHIVKMVRNNVMDHFMSYVIFQKKIQVGNLKSLKDVGVEFPYTPHMCYEINTFIIEHLVMDKFEWDDVVVYESLPHRPLKGISKNEYGVTPNIFFKDAQKVESYFKFLKRYPI